MLNFGDAAAKAVLRSMKEVAAGGEVPGAREYGSRRRRPQDRSDRAARGRGRRGRLSAAGTNPGRLGREALRVCRAALPPRAPEAPTLSLTLTHSLQLSDRA